MAECSTKGICKEKQIPKIRDYYGSGWVGPGLTRNFVCVENRPKIRLPKPVLIFGVVVYHVYSVCTLLKVVGYYELSVLSMSVMGFQKKSLDRLTYIQFILGFFEFFNFAKSLNSL